jgi:hypothetical protein
VLLSKLSVKTPLLITLISTELIDPKLLMMSIGGREYNGLPNKTVVLFVVNDPDNVAM